MENVKVNQIEIEQQRLKISIIGFGSFAKLAAKHLVLAGAEVLVTDVVDKSKEAEELGVRFVSLEEACKSKIIILAVPMEAFEKTLKNISTKLQPGTLVLDVCSLKMFSCKLMKWLLPENVEIIGTHPLFGPQSAPNSIIGMKIAVCNVNARKETLAKVKTFLEKLGLKVIMTTPEEHDEQMAISQALTHFIGQACKKMNLKRVEMSTLTFDKLMDIVDVIKNDTPALFNNMQKMNPFALDARNKFVEACKELNTHLICKDEVSRYCQ